MENKPLVTVICLCYNHSKYVVESLNSVLNQEYKNVELIIVDDFSTDNSVIVIENWLKDKPNTLFIINETNIGSTKSFNKALNLANGDYILDLAADDILFEFCIEYQIQTFIKNTFEKLAIVYGNAWLISENGDFISHYFEVDKFDKTLQFKKEGFVYNSILSGENVLCSVSALYKTSVLRSLGGYDENLAYEDLDIWIRISRDHSIAYVDDFLVKKRILSDSLGTEFHKKNSKKSQLINQSTYLILQKAYQLNRTKLENKALLKRVHYEMMLNSKNRNLKLLSKWVLFEIKIGMKNILTFIR
ncbi:MAG: glycosyltransferase [Flavobacterium sp.]|nr:glycosyltransferase [Flavobacterium sp.]